MNLGKHRATVVDAVHSIPSLIETSPDFVILNFGVVDACTRPIPLWYSDRVNSDGKSLIDQLLRAFNGKVIDKNRAFFTKLRGHRPWIDIGEFEQRLMELIKLIDEGTKAKISLLRINKPSQRVEAQLPGSIKNVSAYNEVISMLSRDHNATLIDVSDLDIETHYPDGVHYSTEGNKLIAQRLARAIKEQFAGA